MSSSPSVCFSVFRLVLSRHGFPRGRKRFQSHMKSIFQTARESVAASSVVGLWHGQGGALASGAGAEVKNRDVRNHRPNFEQQGLPAGGKPFATVRAFGLALSGIVPGPERLHDLQPSNFDV